jgi:hypothetical protein
VVVVEASEEVVVEPSKEVVVLWEVLELVEGMVSVVDTSATVVLVDSLMTVVTEEAVLSESLPRRPKYAPTPAPANTMTTATAMPTINPVRRRGGGACHPGVYPEGGGGGGV